MTRQKTSNSVHPGRQQSSMTYAPILYPSVEYRAIFKTVLIGTFVLIAVVSILLFISYFALHNTQVAPRIIPCAVGLVYLAIAYILWGKGRHYVASHMLIGFYFAIATIVQFFGGVNLPFGLLGFAICIVLTGILLGARNVLYATGVSISIILLIQTYVSTSHASPFAASSSFGDAAAHSSLLAILGLISWLFGRRTEYLLHKRELAEAELIKEKTMLEIHVQERTEQLRQAQLDEMEQLYQFAEIGQLSTALLHDLANHIAVLNFDIADLKKHQHNKSLDQVEESISYLEQAVAQVRKHLQGKNTAHTFEAIACIESSTSLAAPKAADAHVQLSLVTSEKQLYLYGDPLRLTHVVNILIQNAIDAYDHAARTQHIVTVIVEHTTDDVIVRVRDTGSGITPARRELLFTPLKSSKKDGLGVGLYIARKIVETHFNGTLALSDIRDYTEFIITIPKASP